MSYKICGLNATASRGREHGMEVVVENLRGEQDKPIVTGFAHNGKTSKVDIRATAAKAQFFPRPGKSDLEILRSARMAALRAATAAIQ